MMKENEITDKVIHTAIA